MSIDYIKKKLNENEIDFGPHVVNRMIQFSIDLDQILDVIKHGVLNKKEPDERSNGKFIKYTLTKGKIGVVVKNSDIPFIITAFRR